MPKQVLFDTAARRSLERGVDTIANAVKITMGPKGKQVVIDRGTPVWTLDGVTVAKAIDNLEDPIENMGAEIVKNVANTTNDEAGDGTSTATLLVQALLNEGLRAREQGTDPIAMRRAFEDAGEKIVAHLRKHAVPVENKEQMKAIATISSRDPEIGEVISEIYDNTGKDGVITTEEVKQVGIDYELVEGLQIDNGLLVPHFLTNVDRQVAEIEKPYILVTSENIRMNEDIAPLLNQILRTEAKSLLIIAEDLQGEALATVIINKLKGMMNVAAIKAPGYGDNKVEHLRDICAITGAEHICEEQGTRVEEATLEQLGEADRVVAYRNRTIIVGGQGSKKEIKGRISTIKAELKDVASSYKKDNLNRRMAKLKGGVAIIRVGDVTEEASREKQYRIEDAINATKSAIEEGVIVGGGMALYEASKELESLIDKSKDSDYIFGIKTVIKAIKQPARQILLNQGLDANVVIAQGYNLPPEVIDPLKVARIAIEQSLSVVGLFLSTGAVVFEKPENKKELSTHHPDR